MPVGLHDEDRLDMEIEIVWGTRGIYALQARNLCRRALRSGSCFCIGRRGAWIACLTACLLHQATADAPQPHQDCSQEGRCKAESFFREYAGRHTAALRQLAEGKNVSRPGVLLCQPMYGLGNRVRSVMSCFCLAFASERLLIVDWDHKYTKLEEHEISDMPGGQPASLDELFDPPGFDWSIRALEGFMTVDEIRAEVLRIGDWDAPKMCGVRKCTLPSRMSQAPSQNNQDTFQTRESLFVFDQRLHTCVRRTAFMIITDEGRRIRVGHIN